jgi:hypothetical protein
MLLKDDPNESGIRSYKSQSQFAGSLYESMDADMDNSMFNDTFVKNNISKMDRFNKNNNSSKDKQNKD